MKHIFDILNCKKIFISIFWNVFDIFCPLSVHFPRYTSWKTICFVLVSDLVDAEAKRIYINDPRCLLTRLLNIRRRQLRTTCPVLPKIPLASKVKVKI